MCFAGGIGRSPLSKASAYAALFRNNSSVTLIGPLPVTKYDDPYRY
jgi:hypothetical protein